MSLTFSPKKREKRILGPDLDLSNTLTVNSAKAIERGVLPTFFLMPSSEKKILTKISPIKSSVSWTTLKSIALESEEAILYLSALLYSRMLRFMDGIMSFSCSWPKECLMILLMFDQVSSSEKKIPFSYESRECL